MLPPAPQPTDPAPIETAQTQRTCTYEQALSSNAENEGTYSENQKDMKKKTLTYRDESVGGEHVPVGLGTVIIEELHAAPHITCLCYTEVKGWGQRAKHARAHTHLATLG